MVLGRLDKQYISAFDSWCAWQYPFPWSFLGGYVSLYRKMSLWRVCTVTLRHTATHCNALRHTATRCDTLQHADTHDTAWHCTTLHDTAWHCDLLQTYSLIRLLVRLTVYVSQYPQTCLSLDVCLSLSLDVCLCLVMFVLLSRSIKRRLALSMPVLFLLMFGSLSHCIKRCLSLLITLSLDWCLLSLVVLSLELSISPDVHLTHSIEKWWSYCIERRFSLILSVSLSLLIFVCLSWRLPRSLTVSSDVSLSRDVCWSVFISCPILGLYRCKPSGTTIPNADRLGHGMDRVRATQRRLLGRTSITPRIHVTHKHQFCPADVTPSPSQSSRNTHSTWSWTSGATALIDCCSLHLLTPPLQKKKGGTPWAKKSGNRARLHPWSGRCNLNAPIYLSTSTSRYMEIYRDGKLRVQSLYTCMYSNKHTSRKKEPEDTLVNHTDISPQKSSYTMKCPRTQSKYMDDTPWH